MSFHAARQLGFYHPPNPDAKPMSLFTDKSIWIIRRLMREFALSAEDGAAICGNLGHESAGFTKLQEMKPAVAGSRGGYGFAQWTGPRRRAFEAWCKRMSLLPSSDEANYGYLVTELRTTEKGAIPAVKNAVGLEAKVIAFEAHFERAGVKHYDSRLRYAREALAAYSAAGSQPTPVPPPPAPEAPPAPALTPARGIVPAIVLMLLAAAGWFQHAIFEFFHWLF